MSGVGDRDSAPVSKSIRSFRDLEVFKLAYQTGLEVHRLSLTFPKVEQYALADQMRRASKSICANIAEGFAKQRVSSAEYRRYLMMAVGSADEMQVWVMFATDLGYLEKEQSATWSDGYSRIARMLQGLVTRWDERSRARPDP